MILKKSQKGITLFLVIVILAVVLAVAMGLGTLLVGQLKMIRGMGDSVKALYAADTGIEKILKVVIADEEDLNQYYPGPSEDETESLDNNSSYRVEVSCCKPGPGGCKFVAGGIPNTCHEACKQEGYDRGRCYSPERCSGEVIESYSCSSGVCCCLGEGAGTCPSGLTEDEECNATKYCIRSIGKYGNVKRAIEVEYEPVVD